MKTRNSKPSIVILVLIMLTMASAGIPAHGQDTPRLQQGDFVAICGDSITEQRLYSVYIQDYLLMCQPAGNLRTLQAGWDGEQAPGFQQRMKYDVLTLGPNVATTCYGMNDIEHIWKYVKGASLANFDFGDTSSLRQAIAEVFDELNSNPQSDLTLRFRDPLSKKLLKVA